MKYIIEIPDDVQYVLLNGKADNKYYTAVRPVAELEELNSDYINENFGVLQEAAYQRGFDDAHRISGEEYQRGLNDAWEAARRIIVDTDHGGLALGTLSGIFGTQSCSYIMRENTAQDAIAKLKAYEGNKDEPIKAGDLVERYIDGKLDSKGIYLQEDGGYWRCLFYTGAIFMTLAYPKGQFKKTGKHYDIASILEAMRK